MGGIDIINGSTECTNDCTIIILIDRGVGDGNMGDDIVHGNYIRLTGTAAITITDVDLNRVNIVLITVCRVFIIGSVNKAQSPGTGIDIKESLIISSSD